ncbi:hypothetical protein Tco_1184941 [Tanacetum coccineum]
MKGAPKCMRISGFMHGVNNPVLTKRLNEHVPNTMEEMMIASTAFIRGEAAVTGKKKGQTSWRAQEQSKQHASEWRSDFRSKLSHLIKEIKQGKDQLNAVKKEVPTKDKSMAIYMIQPCHRVTRQKVTQSFKHVSEITFPSLTTSCGTEGPLVIEAEISGHMIHRMLLVTIGDADHSTKAWMNFMIVRSLSLYNGIIGRPGIREIQAVPSTAHRMLKFPVDGGIVTICSTILVPAECATVTTSSKEIPKEAGVHHENFKNIRISLIKKWQSEGPYPQKDARNSEHRLNIREGYSPIQQKKRGQATKLAKAIQAEVQKLAEAGIIREVYYHDWLSNPVMVKKHDSSWRMCVDFTDLNKACPRDCYPLPEIDWKV